MSLICHMRARMSRLTGLLPRRERLRWLAPAALVSVLVVSCAAPSTSVLDERLVDGQTIRSTVAQDRPTVVLIYPPGYCFVCAPQLAHWQQFDREGRVKLALILAETPSDSDKQALILRRIRVSGVLSTHFWSKGPTVPREYLIEAGRVRLEAVGVKQTGRNSNVLREIRNRVPKTEAMERGRVVDFPRSDGYSIERPAVRG